MAKYKTTFKVEFDIADLISKCAEYIRDNLVVGKTRFIYEKDKVKVLKGGLEGGDKQTSQYIYDVQDFKLPDILSKCGKLQDFKNNPQKFIDEVGAIIKNQMRHVIVDGIKYQKIGNDHFYAQELFENVELNGYLNKNMLEVEKSIKSVVY